MRGSADVNDNKLPLRLLLSVSILSVSFLALGKAGLTNHTWQKLSNLNLPGAHIATEHVIARVFSIISISVLRDLETDPTSQPTSPWPVPLPCSTRIVECKQHGWMIGLCVCECVCAHVCVCVFVCVRYCVSVRVCACPAWMCGGSYLVHQPPAAGLCLAMHCEGLLLKNRHVLWLQCEDDAALLCCWGWK